MYFSATLPTILPSRTILLFKFIVLSFTVVYATLFDIFKALAMLSASEAAADITIDSLLLIPFASPFMKSGIHFSYSRRGPLSGLEKCKNSLIFPPIPLTESTIPPNFDLIPSINPCTKSFPHSIAFLGSDFIKSMASLNPVTIVSFIFATFPFIPPTIFEKT